MKNILIILGFLLSVYAVNGQSYDGKGDSKFNVGYEAYGFGNGIRATYDYGLGIYFLLGPEELSILMMMKMIILFMPERICIWELLLIFLVNLIFTPDLNWDICQVKKIGIAGYVGFRYFITEENGCICRDRK